MRTALTIAGSDSSGGAGIQADIKTMITNGVYAMSAITALTAQNTTGVQAILNVTPEFLGQELDSVFQDIYPGAVKIGMVSDKDLIHVIAEKLKQYKAENIVVDPVMVATSGAKLISDDAVEILKQELFPLADVLTPNIPEAEVLVEMSVTNAEEMIEAAGKISETYHCAVLCKGGHSINDANDLLYYDGKYCWFEGKRIDNPNTHGTGCTLSSAIASNLAKGYDLQTAVKEFTHKHFIIRSNWVYGKGGNNFVNRVLETAEKGQALSVASDQFGSPTSAKDLARMILYLIDTNEYGTYHVTCSGVCNRYEFATEILRLAGKEIELRSVPTEQSDLSSVRPPYAVLDNFILRIIEVYDMPDWKASLKEYMDERAED